MRKEPEEFLEYFKRLVNTGTNEVSEEFTGYKKPESAAVEAGAMILEVILEKFHIKPLIGIEQSGNIAFRIYKQDSYAIVTATDSGDILLETVKGHGSQVLASISDSETTLGTIEKRLKASIREFL